MKFTLKQHGAYAMVKAIWKGWLPGASRLPLVDDQLPLWSHLRRGCRGPSEQRAVKNLASSPHSQK